MQGRLDTGGVIRKVLDIYVDQASVLMPAAAVVFVFTGVLSTVLVLASPGLALIATLLGLIATTLFTGMVVELVADVQDGRRDATPRQLLQAATPVLGSLILVAIVAGIGIVIGFILIIIPGLILLTIWSVAAPVVVLERPPGLGALGRSRALVRGHGWQVFGVILVLGISVSILGGILEIAADSAGAGVGLVVRVVIGVLTAPLSALAAAVLYFELLRLSGSAAPVPAGPGPAPPPPPPPEQPNPFGSPQEEPWRPRRRVATRVSRPWSTTTRKPCSAPACSRGSRSCSPVGVGSSPRQAAWPLPSVSSARAWGPASRTPAPRPTAIPSSARRPPGPRSMRPWPSSGERPWGSSTAPGCSSAPSRG